MVADSTQPDSDNWQEVHDLSDRSLGAVQELLAVLRDSSHMMTALMQRTTQLEALAWSDPLTGLLNRRGLEQTMALEEARAGRYGVPATVMILDVHNLKRLNDEHGHLAGDALLRAVGASLRAGARGSDIVARYGGDEFVVLLPGAGLDGAEAFLERVRAPLRSAQVPGGPSIPIQLAVGIATRDETGSLTAALDLADQRLLVDKQHGPA